MYLGVIVFVSIIGISVVGIFSIIQDGQELSEINLTSQQKQNEIAAETNNISAVYMDGMIKFTNSQNEKIHIIQIRIYDGLGNFVESYTVSEIILGNTMSEILSENLAIPLDVFEDQSGDPSGNTFVGVTIHGVEFPILLDHSNDNDSDNNDGTGDGDSILDGIGVYLTIQNIGSNGMVYFGDSNYSDSNHSYQTDIRAYVDVGDTSDWGIVIGDTDYTEVLAVPAFGVQYQYDPNSRVPSLVDVPQSIPNVLGFSTEKPLSGNVNTAFVDDKITFTGTGESIYKLNDYSNQNLLLRGDVGVGNIISIITSDVDLINESYDSTLGYITYSDSIDPSTNSFSVISGIDSIHTGILTFDAYAFYNGDLCSVERLSENYGSVGRESEYPCLYKTINRPSISTVLVKTNNGDHYIITGDSTTAPLLTMWNWYHEAPFAYDQYNNNFYFEIYDTLPSIQLAGFSEDFEQVMEFPIQDTYIYVKVDGGTNSIKGESFNLDEDVFFYVNNLPSDIAYDISKSEIVGALGKTSSDGVISLLYDDVDFGVSSSPGGILTIYPDSTSYMVDSSVDSSDDFGVGMIDVYNERSIILTVTGDDLLYIPQNYVYWVFPVGVEVTNLSVDDISLEYLNKDYALNEALYIPVIPSANTIYATINGEDVEILMRDVSSITQTKQVPIESSVSSDYMTGESSTVSSNISTSTFLTATHTGTMYANLDFKVGGSVDFTMDSSYTGGFTKSTSCNWHGASSPSRSYSCNNYLTPSDPSSITNMLSLTADQQSQLTIALNNGQVSNLTVEVDIIRNMGINNDLETILLYTSDSAQASVTSTFSEIGYSNSNQVHITYLENIISENIAIDVDVGDMVEFVIRVNLEVSGAPAPSSENAVYSSYVQATTELGGGVISVGMS